MPKLSLFAVLVFIAVIPGSIYSQAKTDEHFATILKNNNGIFNSVLSHPSIYRYQIIYTKIDRDKNNIPHFKNYYLNYDPQQYFNPASTVKMPLAFLSLEKLHSLENGSVNKFTSLQIDSSYEGQKGALKDSTSANGFPSIAHYIRKVFLVSDNDAYNRMYQFLGQQYINRTLHNKGYGDVRITRQFMGFTAEQNRHTNPIRFIKDNGALIYTQPAQYSTDSFNFSQVNKFGKAHYDRNDSLVNEPFDFTTHNNISLGSLRQMLQSVLFPQSVAAQQRFIISNNDRSFLLQYMSQFPGETNYPKYDTSKFFDSYVKFFMRDSTHKMPAYIRVFNKVGWAYGFMTDVSYIADFKNKVEFMLAATIYVNSDEVINDNKYEYETIGYPFFYHLAHTVYQYELKRKRAFKPNLSSFVMPYEKREATDKRLVVTEVDN